MIIENHIINNRLIVLKKNFFAFKKNFEYDKKKIKLHSIDKKFKTISIWKNKKIANNLGKEYSLLENSIKKIDQIQNSLEDIDVLLDLLIESKDKNLYQEIISNLNCVEKKINKLKINSTFSNKYDFSNCYIDIQPGSGGIDAQDWANMMMRMYLRWSEIKNFKVDIIEESKGEIAGIKSATLHIIGDYAYGWLKNETGIHRLVRKSPFDSNHRRHTSFSSAFVYPEINDDDCCNLMIKTSDLRIDVYRASGAGGQHVNRTESAVRITHIPTNIVVQCQNNRSQHKNKEQAMKQIKAKLYELNIQKKTLEKQKIEKNKSNIGWSRQIRSYIIDNSIVKDLRTGLEKRNIQEILNGDLDPFIKASLKLL